MRCWNWFFKYIEMNNSKLFVNTGDAVRIPRRSVQVDTNIPVSDNCQFSLPEMRN
jgi:hypothetical protein